MKYLAKTKRMLIGEDHIARRRGDAPIKRKDYQRIKDELWVVRFRVLREPVCFPVYTLTVTAREVSNQEIAFLRGQWDFKFGIPFQRNPMILHRAEWERGWRREFNRGRRRHRKALRRNTYRSRPIKHLPS